MLLVPRALFSAMCESLSPPGVKLEVSAKWSSRYSSASLSTMIYMAWKATAGEVARSHGRQFRRVTV